MGDRKTLGVHIDEDSDLYDDFEEYRDRGGFASNSEALRQVLRNEFEEEDEVPTGLAAAVSKIAGEQLSRSMDLLAKYIIVTAVALIAFDAGAVGGVAWAGIAVVYGVLGALTTIAVATGAAEILNPEGVGSTDAAPSGDEVDA